MNGRKLFLILDIDGVLLESYGYRLACLDTINDFLKQMGQPFLSVERDIPDAFDAAGMSAEWDIVPLTLAAFVNWYVQETGDLPEEGIFPPRCDKTVLADNEAFSRMLLAQAEEYASLLDPSKTVMDAIGQAYMNGKCSGLAGLRKTDCFERFFVDTLNPWKCPFFAQLMSRLLGTQGFEAFYGIPAAVECDSYLETKDRLLISEKYRKLLPDLAGKSVWPCVMTYRPTLYPEFSGNKESSYFVNTPEGECAMRLLGWTDGRIPMIGGGSLCYIEEKYSLRREHYVKPHPFHSLAAALMGCCGDEILALETARRLCEEDPSSVQNPAGDLLAPEEKICLAVLEDSVSGIDSVREAVRVLRKWGYDAEECLCGIISTDAKSARIKAAGADLYPDANRALDTILKNQEGII